MSSCQKQLNEMINMPRVSILPISQENLLLTISGSIVASLGFMYNDYSVILGSMLISPLGQPIIQSVLSMLTNKGQNVANGLASFLVLTVVALIIGFSMGQLNRAYDYYQIPTDKMERLTSDEFLTTNFIIGCFTGFFVAYSRAFNKVDVLHGFALVVALLPPIVNSGLYSSLAYNVRNSNPKLFQKYKEKSINSFKIAYANVVGVALSTLLGFWIFCD